MADSNFTCGNCKYFGNPDIMGSCRRYPQVISRHKNDWCGEFDPKHPITLPIYDIVTDTIKEIPVQNKRGRKPKNVSTVA
jgi:hypothetical protein